MLNELLDNNSFICVEYDDLKSKILNNFKDLIVAHNKKESKNTIDNNNLKEYLTFLQKKAPKRLYQCHFLLAVIDQLEHPITVHEQMSWNKRNILNAAALYVSTQIEKSYQKGVYGLASNWGFFNNADSSTLRTLLLDSLNLTEENPSPNTQDKINLYGELEGFLRAHICLQDAQNFSEVSDFWKIKDLYKEYDPLKELMRVERCLQKAKEQLSEETHSLMKPL